MKMSIIIGVTQMCVGIFLKLLNGLHFKKDLDVKYEFIPQIVFMTVIFGYTCFLIFYKWLAIPYYYNDLHHRQIPNNGTCSPENPGTGDAPMLLNVLIYMILGIFDPTKYKCVFPGQFYIQIIFMILAIIMVPLMLFPKPFILRSRHNLAVAAKGVYQQPEQAEEHEEEEFQFGELMVHQIIETIEFVLGSISNTASYLRLWALSLAHSELATVFWKMLFMQVGVHFAAGGGKLAPITTFIAASVWLAFTIGVLMVMESLSAFLHALRLHWVEFQNKFYKGDGVKFKPFSYERILSGEVDE